MGAVALRACVLVPSNGLLAFLLLGRNSPKETLCQRHGSNSHF